MNLFLSEIIFDVRLSEVADAKKRTTLKTATCRFLVGLWNKYRFSDGYLNRETIRRFDIKVIFNLKDFVRIFKLKLPSCATEATNSSLWRQRGFLTTVTYLFVSKIRLLHQRHTAQTLQYLRAYGQINALCRPNQSVTWVRNTVKFGSRWSGTSQQPPWRAEVTASFGAALGIAVYGNQLH